MANFTQSLFEAHEIVHELHRRGVCPTATRVEALLSKTVPGRNLVLAATLCFRSILPVTNCRRASTNLLTALWFRAWPSCCGQSHIFILLWKSHAGALQCILQDVSVWGFTPFQSQRRSGSVDSWH